MKEKLALALNTGKKKATAIALSTALVLSISALTAFAANSLESLQVTVDDNGAAQYSTDGGQTWSHEVPDGATTSVGQNGEHSIFFGTPSRDAINDVNAAVDAATIFLISLIFANRAIQPISEAWEKQRQRRCDDATMRQEK